MIYGICGFQGAGKDTLAAILIQKHGFIKLAFASKVKDVAALVFSWDRKMLEGDTIASRTWREQVDEEWSERLGKTITPRLMLQKIGTESFRNVISEDIWIAVLEFEIERLTKNDPNVNIVITDCRFPNEIDIIKKYNGKIIHIHRNLPYWFEVYKEGTDVEETHKMHASDLRWIRNDFDITVDNNGTINDLGRTAGVLIH